MWHNLKNCRIICDKSGRLAQVKKRFDVPYTDELRDSIIANNMALLCGALPAYKGQIKKALARGDRVSILHRSTAFLESYFDIIFALNKLTHPGEKRLVELCEQQCTVLPENFRANLNGLFDVMFSEPEAVAHSIERIIDELKRIM